MKRAADGSVEKYKACFVAKGFSQKEGIDYAETFALVPRYSSIWTIISLVFRDGLASPLDGRRDYLPQQSDRGGDIY